MIRKIFLIKAERCLLLTYSLAIPIKTHKTVRKFLLLGAVTSWFHTLTVKHVHCIVYASFSFTTTICTINNNTFLWLNSVELMGHCTEFCCAITKVGQSLMSSVNVVSLFPCFCSFSIQKCEDFLSYKS